MEETKNLVILQKRRCFFIPGPPILLLYFTRSLTDTVLVDLIVYRTCLVSFNMTQAQCSMLRTNASSVESQKLETEIEPYTSMIILAKSLVESILPAMISLFLGPWSDRGGRRPLLIGGFTGFTLMYIGLSLMSHWNINPWYLLIPSLMAQIIGGFGTIIFATVCYISDTSTEEDRTMLFAGIEVSILSGTILGLSTGPIIYNSYGYTGTFSTAVICCTAALLYTYFYIPETVGVDNDAAKGSMFGLFKFSFVRELVTSALLKREGFHRSVVWLSITALTISVMILKGQLSIEYLFTRARLQWDVQQYSYASGASDLLQMVGVLSGVWLFSRVLKLSDTLVAAIALTSYLGTAITTSLTTQTWHMYLAALIRTFGGILPSVLRSIISKSVPPQDLGKVFALSASMQTLSPLGGAPLYTLIYSNYLPPVYPAPVYLVSACFYVLLILFVISIEVLLRNCRRLNYISLVQDNQ